MDTRRHYNMAEGRSLVEQLRNIESDVPEPIMKMAGDDEVKKYLLKQGSVLDQQNVLIGGFVEKTLEQAYMTNGRVTNQEAITKSQQLVLDSIEAGRARWNANLKWFIAVLGILVVPVAEIFFKWLAHKFGISTT